MKPKILVDFIPSGKMTNELIGKLNAACNTMSAQDFATNLASHIAAIAFILHGNNSHDVVKEIFAGVVDDAGIKFEQRRKAFEQAGKEIDAGPTGKPN